MKVAKSSTFDKTGFTVHVGLKIDLTMNTITITSTGVGLHVSIQHLGRSYVLEQAVKLLQQYISTIKGQNTVEASVANQSYDLTGNQSSGE